MATIVRSDDGVSAVSWAAILAGAAASAALTLMLLALGTGLGLSVVSPWSTWSISSTGAATAAGIFMVVVAVMASAVGGYVAGRLRTRWQSVHTNEVYFRDTAHGVLAWAVATVVSAALLGSAAATVAGGAAAGAAQGVSTVAGDRVTGYVDRLLRPNYAIVAPPPGAPMQPAPVPGRPGAALGRDLETDRADLGRLLAASLRDRYDLGGGDRTYLVQMVALRTGLPAADAEMRVAEVIRQAKDTADTARRVTAQLALWLAASMLFGALAAGLAATEGGSLRDDTRSYI